MHGMSKYYKTIGKIMKTYKFKQESYNNIGAEFTHNRKTYMLGFDHSKNPVLYICTGSGEPICEVPVNDNDKFMGFDASTWEWLDIIAYYATSKKANLHFRDAFNNMFR